MKNLGNNNSNIETIPNNLKSPEYKLKQKLLHLFEEISCSVLTGLMKVAVIQPFDLIRFRIQSGGELKNKTTTRELIKSLFKGEGLKVFFKGINVTSFSVFSSSIVQFTLYQEAYNKLNKKFIPEQPEDGPPLDILSTITRLSELNSAQRVDVSKLLRLYSLTCAMSGFISGVGLGLLLTPVDNIRIKLQAAQNVENARERVYRFNNSVDLIKSIYSSSGLRGFYVALPISLLRECTASVIYFGSYEYMKNKEKIEYRRKRIKLHRSFLYGAFAGGVNWLITMPIDVLKTKMISDTIIPNVKDYESYGDCARKVYAQSGYRGFYKGFSVVFLRALIVNGVVLTSFDICRSKYVEKN
jgi:solute carrier family 25 carnitine/acylcarnitine transporter 20/29